MHTIKQTKIISQDLIDSIKFGAEAYLDVNLAGDKYDASDCCNAIQIALYDDIIYDL